MRSRFRKATIIIVCPEIDFFITNTVIGSSFHPNKKVQEKKNSVKLGKNVGQGRFGRLPSRSGFSFTEFYWVFLSVPIGAHRKPGKTRYTPIIR